ncbi:hypothetical protein [Bilophila sp.]|uniref:hypothetical protein n=1 Tax=Bilophila sp. TaxID=1929485 RepID=UPI003077DF4B
MPPPKGFRREVGRFRLAASCRPRRGLRQGHCGNPGCLAAERRARPERGPFAGGAGNPKATEALGCRRPFAGHGRSGGSGDGRGGIA